MENYQAQLKFIISNSKYNQLKLSNKLGVTIVALNRWINGHSVPRKKHIFKIEKIFLKLSGLKAAQTSNSIIKTSKIGNGNILKPIEKDWLIHKVQNIFSKSRKY